MNIDIRGACILVDEPVSHISSNECPIRTTHDHSFSNSVNTKESSCNSAREETGYLQCSSNKDINDSNNTLAQDVQNSESITDTDRIKVKSKTNEGIDINPIQNSLDLNIKSSTSDLKTTSSTSSSGNSSNLSTSPPKLSSSQRDKPILLPNQSSPIKHFAMDIGGSLAKLVYFVQDNSEGLGGKLHFKKFQTSQIEECFNFIIENKLHIDADSSKPKLVRVTGGGAYKFADVFEKRLGCKLIKADEMQCLIWGTNFLLHNIQKESYIYDHKATNGQPKVFTDRVDNPYPYLLVQIGSGVSIIKVDSEDSYQRVDGTSLGGGTFWGLCSLLTGVTDFDEMLELTKKGQSNNVDLVVGDIYGTDYSKVGLSSDTIASSFGKVIYKYSNSHPSNDESSNNNNNNVTGDSAFNNQTEFRKEDIAQSLLKMVSNNIGQIAYLNAQRYGLNKIYFGGFFIRDHPNTMHKISFAIDFWSKGKTKASFLVHDGYLGALGAFLSVDNDEKNIHNDESWWKRTTREIQKLLFATSIRKSSPSTSLSSSRDSINIERSNSPNNNNVVPVTNVTSTIRSSNDDSNSSGNSL